MVAAKASASDPVAAEAAQKALDDGGRAIDAAITGFLAAAGAHDSVLLSPVVALVGGLGVGARLFDGRAVQPGAAAKRPRGHLPGETIPEAARAAVPRSLDLLALLQIYAASRTMTAMVRPGVALARRAGADRRRALLEAFGRRGAQALRSGDGMRQLLLAASAPAGGLFTESDLAQVRPGDDDATFRPLGEGLEVTAVPWAPPSSPRRAQIVVAADGRGMMVALSYVPDEEGIAVPGLELRLPRDAEPVRRNVPRVTPGTPCPAPAPIALFRRAAEAWFAAIGVAGAASLPADAVAPGEALPAQLAALAARTGAGPAVAASTQRRRAQITWSD